jgi:hypothetical protein
MNWKPLCESLAPPLHIPNSEGAKSLILSLQFLNPSSPYIHFHFFLVYFYIGWVGTWIIRIINLHESHH